MKRKECQHVFAGSADEFAEVTADSGEKYSLCGDCFIKGLGNRQKGGGGDDPPEVIGYNVYRSNDPDLPKGQWAKLTPKPIPQSRFKDRSPAPGSTYYYYVTAVNAKGVESEPSA